jgi:hypothetical protein
MIVCQKCKELNRESSLVTSNISDKPQCTTCGSFLEQAKIFITEEELIGSCALNNIKKVHCRNCSICNASLYYLIELADLFIDTNCNCVNYRTQPSKIPWSQIVSWINVQTSFEKQKMICKKWGIEL